MAPDDALEIRVLPATLEDVRAKLLGERGLVTRGERFDAEFEALALAVDRESHAHMELEAFVFASEQDVGRFLARFESADGQRELSVTGPPRVLACVMHLGAPWHFQRVLSDAAARSVARSELQWQASAGSLAKWLLPFLRSYCL